MVTKVRLERRKQELRNQEILAAQRITELEGLLEQAKAQLLAIRGAIAHNEEIAQWLEEEPVPDADVDIGRVNDGEALPEKKKGEDVG